MAGRTLRGIFKNVQDYMRIDQMCYDLSLFRVASKEDEKIALGMVDKIGSTVADFALIASEKNYYNLEAIRRSAQTNEISARALHWIFEIGRTHAELSHLIIAKTVELMDEEQTDEDTRLQAVRGIGAIGRTFKDQLGYKVVEHILDAWNDSDAAVRKEKFEQTKAILSALTWQQVMDPARLLQRLEEFRRAEDAIEGGAARSRYAAQLLKVCHDKQRQDLKNHLE